jgi:uncharacterized protein
MSDGDVFPAWLVERLRPRYRLDWHGIHGWHHWVRVRENGLRLAPATGADPLVVELFALFHDIGRHNDWSDPEHGRRGAAAAAELAGEIPGLDPGRLELLRYACAHHTDGTVESEPTIGTCWDADRLDLERAGIVPRPERLCTDAARDPVVMRWARSRSLCLRLAGVTAST